MEPTVADLRPDCPGQGGPELHPTRSHHQRLLNSTHSGVWPRDGTWGGVLTQTSNIGRYYRNPFAVVPEVTISLGVQFAPWLRGTIGYNILYWSNVARPGNQIDLVVDRFTCRPTRTLAWAPARHARRLTSMAATIGLRASTSVFSSVIESSLRIFPSSANLITPRRGKPGICILVHAVHWIPGKGLTETLREKYCGRIRKPCHNAEQVAYLVRPAISRSPCLRGRSASADRCWSATRSASPDPDSGTSSRRRRPGSRAVDPAPCPGHPWCRERSRP